jgi:hypothetical protein
VAMFLWSMAAPQLTAQDTSLVVSAARRAYFGTIVRANLITLADAESTYYNTHRIFTLELALLRRSDGIQLRFTHGPTTAVSVTMALIDSTGWEATAKSLVDTTVVCYVRGVVRDSIPRSTRTQCPRLNTVPSRLAGGLSLTLPLGWAMRDSAGLLRWNDKVAGALGEAIDISRGRMLLVAHGPDRTTLALGVAPAPKITPQTFVDFTLEERAEYRAQLCEFVQSTLRNVNSPSARCAQLRADSIQDRGALLFEYEHEDGDRQVHAWLVQVATTQAIVTLSFLAGVNDANEYEPTFRRVWRSLFVPERLETRAPN